MSIKLEKLLKKLTETPGPPGREHEIGQLIHETWKPLVDSMEQDRIGNIIANKFGTGPEPRRRIILAAHMDEISLMVKKIVAFPDEESGYGFLKVTNVGGIDLRHLLGQIVQIHSTGESASPLTGIIGALPGRMLSDYEQSQVFDFDDLVVDVGLSYKTLIKRVEVGDFITFRQPMRKLLNQRVAGKALDNRASLAAVSLCLENLQKQEHNWDVLAVATVQEETRYLGAFTSAYSLIPDAAVAVDVTFGRGPGVKDDESYELDAGPVLGIGPNYHPAINKALRDAAGHLEMNLHLEPSSSPGGTDAFGLQISREGIPTATLLIPLRNMHTTVESVALKDIERTGRLLATFISRLEDEFLNDLVDAVSNNA